jgi:peptide/nickel transport system permease protein
MTRLIVRRLLFIIPTLLVVSLLIFVMEEIVPGDVGREILGQYAPAAQVAALDHTLGADKPIVQRYIDWLGGFLTLHWGESPISQQPVFSLTMQRLWNSAQLAALALVIMIPTSIVLGVIAALRRDGIADRIITIASLSLTVVPEFVSGAVLILLFAITLRLFPYPPTIPPGAGPLTRIHYMLLPVIPLMFVELGYIARMARAGMIDALAMPYVRTATLKGLSRRRVILVHALRNALVPTVTVIGTQVGWLLGGLVVVEKLFIYPGIGYLMYQSATLKDVKVLEATVLVIAAIYMFSNLAADVIVALLNPRVRFGR